MKITELVALTENRLAYLNQGILTATQSGNVAEVTRLEAEAQETQTTLDSLRQAV